MLSTAKEHVPLSAAPAVELRGVIRQHASRRRVHYELRADLALERAQVVGVFGSNGSGKSTLMDLIAGRVTPNAGLIKVHGHALHAIRRDQRRRLVHHLCQPHLAAALPGEARAWTLNPTHLFVSAREAWLDRKRNEAPGGGPQVYIFDEPPLEPPYGGLFFERFRTLRSQGCLVLFSTHPSEPWHLQSVRDVCDSYLFMQDGSALVFGSYETFMGHPEVIDYMSALAFVRDGGEGKSRASPIRSIADAAA